MITVRVKGLLAITGIAFANYTQITFMEKRVLGMILTLLGIGGLIAAAVYFMNGGQGTRNIKAIVTFALLGAIFFGAGIRLIQNTKDKAA